MIFARWFIFRVGYCSEAHRDRREKRATRTADPNKSRQWGRRDAGGAGGRRSEKQGQGRGREVKRPSDRSIKKGKRSHATRRRRRPCVDSFFPLFWQGTGKRKGGGGLWRRCKWRRGGSGTGGIGAKPIKHDHFPGSTGGDDVVLFTWDGKRIYGFRVYEFGGFFLVDVDDDGDGLCQRLSLVQ